LTRVIAAAGAAIMVRVVFIRSSKDRGVHDPVAVPVSSTVASRPVAS
jgi:hypothetical protein